MTLLFYTKIAGVNSGPDAGRRQKGLSYMARKPEIPWQLTLFHEPDNEYDPNAVKVLVSVPKGIPDLFQLGYLPKETARKLIISMNRDGVKPVAVLREVTGGEDGQSFGANLAIFDARDNLPGRS